MIPYIVATILVAVLSPFLYRLLYGRNSGPTFVRIPVVEEEKQKLHYLGAVQEEDTKYTCYVVEQK